MAVRTISIKVTIDNRDAINAARAQAVAMKAAGMEMRANVEHAKKLETQETKLTKAKVDLARSQESLNRSMAKTAKEAEKADRSFGSLLKRTFELYNAFKIVDFGARAIQQSIGEGFANAYEFQGQLTRIGAQGGFTGAQLETLRDSIHDLANELPVAQTEIAEGAGELVKMGYNGATLVNVLGAVTKASLLMGESVADAGKVLFTTSTIFGYSSEQAEEVASKLVYAANQSALSLNGMAVAMNYAAAPARQAGFSFEQLAAIMARLKNAGFGDSTIGTSIRTLSLGLSDINSKFFKEMGIQGQKLPLERLLELFQKMDPNKIAQVFSKPALGPLQELQRALGDTSDSLHKFVEDLNGDTAQTAMKTAIDRFNKDLPGSVGTFKNSLTELADLILSGGVGKAMGWLLRTTRDQVNAFNDVLDLPGAFDTAKNFNEAQQKSLKERFFAAGGDQSELDFWLKAKGATGINEVIDLMNADKKSLEKALKDQEALAEQAKLNAERMAAAMEASRKALGSSFQGFTLSQFFVGEPQDQAELDQVIQKYADFLNQALKLKDLELAKSIIDDMNRVHNKFNNTLAEGAKQAQKDADAFRKLNDSLREKALHEAAEDFKVLRVELELLGDAITGGEWEVFERMSQQTADLEKFFSLMGEQDKAAEVKKFSKSLGDLKENSEFTGPFKQWARDLEDMNFAFETGNVLVGAMEQSIEGLSQGIGNNLVGAIFGVKTAFVDFGEIFKQVAVQVMSELTRLLIKMLAIRAIMLFAGAGVASGAPIGGSAIPGLESTPGAVLAASGTDRVVTSPTMFVAGDAGKERVQITPRAKMASKGGGEGITVVIQGDVYGAEKFNEAVSRARSSYV